MYKVKIKVTQPVDPILYPPGQAKDQITFVELFVDSDCENESSCMARQECTEKFLGCSTEIESVETVEKPQPGFNELKLEDTKQRHTAKAQNTKSKTTGKQGDD